MISNRSYLTIIMLFVTIFTLFMFIGISSNTITDQGTNRRVLEQVRIKQKDTLTSDSLNMDITDPNKEVSGSKVSYAQNKLTVAILAESQDDVVTKLLVEWCVYNKYLYQIHTALPKKEDITKYKLILFGDIDFSGMDYERLYDYAKLGKTMIFTKLPNHQIIHSDQKLADFFGIKDLVNQKVVADGIQIFPNFMIGGSRTYQKDDYFGSKDDTTVSIPYYKLSAGYDIYAVGLLDNQKERGIENKDLPPLLWRAKTENSFVFVVNGDIFKGMSLLGVLTSFMTQEKECYLYPIVNAQTISLVGYPYFSDENEQTIQQIYSRSSEALGRDILWPNIVHILKNYGVSFNFFAASQLDYLDEVGPKQDYIDYYLTEINKLPGDMGLSLGQVSKMDLDQIVEKNNVFFSESLPEYEFTALYSGNYETDLIKDKLKHQLLDKISLVISDYKQGDKLLSFLDEDTLSVKFNLNGYQHETLDDLQMSFIQNSLGMCNMKVDINRVIYPKDSLDEWNNLSLIWSSGQTYFNDYSEFDMVSMYELEKRVRRFLALDFIYEYKKDEIDIQIDNFDEEAYFILSIYDKSIHTAMNAEVSRIAANTYLVKATASDVRLLLKEDNILETPKDIKTIPSNPKTMHSRED